MLALLDYALLHQNTWLSQTLWALTLGSAPPGSPPTLCAECVSTQKVPAPTLLTGMLGWAHFFGLGFAFGN